MDSPTWCIGSQLYNHFPLTIRFYSPQYPIQYMFSLSQHSTPQDYRQYASSTLKLNQALNSELNSCYTKIKELASQIAQHQETKKQHLAQMAHLKSKLHQMHQEKTTGRFRTINTERIIPLNIILEGNGLHADTLAATRSNIAARKTFNLEKKVAQTQTKDIDFDLMGEKPDKAKDSHLIEIKKLRQSNVALKEQLKTCEEEIQDLRTSLFNFETQIHKLQQKLQQRSNTIEEISFQRDQLLEELKSKQNAINSLYQKLKTKQHELQKSRNQSFKIKYLEQTITLFEQRSDQYQRLDKLKLSNQQLKDRIKQLEKFIEILQAQNLAMKNSSKHIERRDSKSSQAKKQAILQTELRIVKQQCANQIKQNIILTESNSKLDKRKSELIAQLQSLKHQKQQLKVKIAQMVIQRQQILSSLQEKEAQVQQVKNKLAAKQSQEGEMKRMISQEIIEQLERGLKSSNIAKGVLASLGSKKADEKEKQVPVRDASIRGNLPKCRSTTNMNDAK